MNRTIIQPAAECIVPPGAIITNYALCKLCKEPYLRESYGTDLGFCGRFWCYLARLFRSTSFMSKIQHVHPISRGEWGITDHHGTAHDSRPITVWASERVQQIREVRVSEMTRYQRAAKRHRALKRETL